MGNCFEPNRKGNGVEQSTEEDKNGRAAAPDTTSTEKPKPQIFALMRNGHEVIRGNVVEIEEYLDQNDLENALKSYHALHKWMGMHMRMEEGNSDDLTPKGFFSLLDEKFDGVAKDSQLRDDHSELTILEEAVTNSAKDSDIEKFKEAFLKFKESNESHLQKEEGIMMPKVMALTKSGANMKELMKNEILATVLDSPDFKFFVQHANFILDKHHGGKPRARVFDHALWACATPEQWDEWKGWIKDSVPEERFQEISEAIGA